MAPSVKSKSSLIVSHPSEVLLQLEKKVVGQHDSLEQIIPYLQMYNAGIAPGGRPAGVFLLLGPTGTGKTKTAEALTEVLHGSSKFLLKIDCGEFQLAHETAKLIGAPPGYLGHRETKPQLSQERISASASERCPLSIVLFDEVEKAHSSFTDILLGIFDHGTMRLGDGSTANFENTLIFLTSNLGAKELSRDLQHGLGFTKSTRVGVERRQAITDAACKKRFSPEFLNRLDAVISYDRLNTEDLRQILELELAIIQNRFTTATKCPAFILQISNSAKEWLLSKGFSAEYGARELKRVLNRHLVHKIASMISDGQLESGITIYVQQEDDVLSFTKKG